jgi:hypothetical protein
MLPPPPWSCLCQLFAHCRGVSEESRGKGHLALRTAYMKHQQGGDMNIFGGGMTALVLPGSLAYNNLSCPLEVVVTAETVSHYKEDHFQLEALRSDRMD